MQNAQQLKRLRAILCPLSLVMSFCLGVVLSFFVFIFFLSFLINVVQIGFRFAFLSHPFFSPSTHSHFFKVLISFYCFSTHCRYQLSVVSVSVHCHFPLFKIVLSFSYSRALSSTYRRADFFH